MKMENSRPGLGACAGKVKGGRANGRVSGGQVLSQVELWAVQPPASKSSMHHIHLWGGMDACLPALRLPFVASPSSLAHQQPAARQMRILQLHTHCPAVNLLRFSCPSSSGLDSTRGLMMARHGGLRLASCWLRAGF